MPPRLPHALPHALGRPVLAAAVATAAVAAAILPVAPVQAGTATAAPSAQGGAGDPVVPGVYVVVPKETSAPDARHVTDTVEKGRSARLHRIAADVGATPVRETTAVLPSFTAHLDGRQVAALRSRPDVLTVRPVRARKVTVYPTPGILGLTGTGPGTWAGYGGTGAAGRGVVIGMIDSGVWPEAPAFTNHVPALATTATATVGTAYRTSESGTAMRKSDGGIFTGDCSGAVTGKATQGWTPALCNQAIVSARAFPPASGWVNPGPNDPLGREYASPRDGLGHGTHTASTAAGRTVTISTLGGVPPTTQSTGIAPAAAIAVYKACWTSKTQMDPYGYWINTCTDDSLVAAIDRAVKDHVDVINLSISGATDDPLDPVDLALLGAAKAGILPVVSAGNDGPAAGTVNHPSPWSATVGATTIQAPLAVADFSGRGPSLALGGMFLKPDLVAPGTDVYASVPPPMGAAATTPAYDVMSGTSMATPHVSGLAALILGAHPLWSPMMVRSALSLRATQLASTSVFAQGSGMPTGPAMATPDLLMDATPADYAAVLSWITGTSGGKYPADLNQPNIVLPDVGARWSTIRTFVAQRRGAWTVRASLPGYAVTVEPRRAFALHPGQRITVRIAVRRTTARTGIFATGSVLLDGGRGVARLPLLARHY